MGEPPLLRRCRPELMMRDLSSDEAFEFYRKFLEFLSSSLQPESYLEIGLAAGQTFQRLIPHCKKLRGVDPAPPRLSELPRKCELFAMSSNEYFRLHPGDTYDLVFVDGLHEHQQVLRDIRNCLSCLKPNGLIAVHDTFPTTPAMTDPNQCGDTYKAMVELRADRSLELLTLPITYGLTLIRKIGNGFPWV